MKHYSKCIATKRGEMNKWNTGLFPYGNVLCINVYINNWQRARTHGTHSHTLAPFLFHERSSGHTQTWRLLFVHRTPMNGCDIISSELVSASEPEDGKKQQQRNSCDFLLRTSSTRSHSLRLYSALTADYSLCATRFTFGPIKITHSPWLQYSTDWKWSIHSLHSVWAREANEKM